MSCRACAAPSGLGPIRPGPAQPSAVRGRAGEPRRRGVQGAGGKSCGRFPASGRGSSGAEGEKPVAGGAAWCRSCGLAGRGAGERRGPRGRVRVGGRGREMGAESSDTVPPPSACVISSAEAGKLMERDKASPVAPVYTLLSRGTCSAHLPAEQMPSARECSLPPGEICLRQCCPGRGGEPAFLLPLCSP